MKTICGKQAKVPRDFAYFVQHDQLGIITEPLTEHIFMAGSVVASYTTYGGRGGLPLAFWIN